MPASALAAMHGGVRLDRRTRMLYDERHVFINGESFRAAGRDATLMRRLADRRALSAAQRRRAERRGARTAGEWAAAGWLQLPWPYERTVDERDDMSDPNRNTLSITSRSEFHAALRTAFAEAAAQRLPRNLARATPTSPTGRSASARVIEQLTPLGRRRSRKLTVLAQHFDEVRAAPRALGRVAPPVVAHRRVPQPTPNSRRARCRRCCSRRAR